MPSRTLHDVQRLLGVLEHLVGGEGGAVGGVVGEDVAGEVGLADGLTQRLAHFAGGQLAELGGALLEDLGDAGDDLGALLDRGGAPHGGGGRGVLQDGGQCLVGEVLVVRGDLAGGGDGGAVAGGGGHDDSLMCDDSDVCGQLLIEVMVSSSTGRSGRSPGSVPTVVASCGAALSSPE